MKQREIIDKLQQDVEIPEVVQQKTQEAFAKIKEQKTNKTVMLTEYKKRRVPKKRIVAMVAAATLVLGAVSVGAAAYMNWSKSLSDGMQATEEQKQHMEETNMASSINVADTQADVTVTAIQSIVDNYYAQIAFKVEGYQVEDGAQPDFEGLSVKVGDQEYSFPDISEDATFKANGVFYDEAINYTLEDGTLEYRLTLQNNTEKGFFLNKPIHVELNNLGTVAQAEFIPDVDATWSFDWTLEGSDEIKEFAVNQELGETATVKQIEMSPISIRVLYDFTQKEIQETANVENENGEITAETYTITTYPPEPMGVKYKDGTEVKYACDSAGPRGYLGEGSTDYMISAEFDRIIDVDQVESILFRSTTGAGDAITFEIPIN